MADDTDTRPKTAAAGVRRKKNSRHGCRNCKLRKIKCDEQRPRCKRCNVYGVLCNFDLRVPDLQPLSEDTAREPPSRQVSRLPEPRAPIGRDVWISDGMTSFSLDARSIDLLHCFIGCSIFAKDDIHLAHTKSSLLKLAFTNTYLMRALLALVHVRSRNLTNAPPSQRSLDESYHWSQCTTLFRKRLNHPIQPEDRDPLWGTAAALSIVTFSSLDSTNPEELWPLKPFESSDLEWLRMGEGKMALWHLTDPSRPDSVFYAMSPALHEMNTPLVPAGIHGVPPALAALCNLHDFSTPKNNPYFCAVHSLAKIHNLANEHVTLGGAMILSHHMQQEFRLLLKAKDPVALLILHLWYRKARHAIWWINARARTESPAICLYLRRYHGYDSAIQALLPTSGHFESSEAAAPLFLPPTWCSQCIPLFHSVIKTSDIEREQNRPAFLEIPEPADTRNTAESENLVEDPLRPVYASTANAQGQLPAEQDVKQEAATEPKFTKQKQLPVVQSTISDDRACEGEFEIRTLKRFFGFDKESRIEKQGHLKPPGGDTITHNSQQDPTPADINSLHNVTEFTDPGGLRVSSSNNALQDYQMQLLVLEQLNKKRLMMARQEQDSKEYADKSAYTYLSRNSADPVVPAESIPTSFAKAVTVLGATEPDRKEPRLTASESTAGQNKVDDTPKMALGLLSRARGFEGNTVLTMESLQTFPSELQIAKDPEPPVPPRHQIIHRISNDGHRRMYLDLPQWVEGGMSIRDALVGNLPIRDVQDYLSKHPKVCCVIYRDYNTPHYLNQDLKKEHLKKENLNDLDMVNHQRETIEPATEVLFVALGKFFQHHGFDLGKTDATDPPTFQLHILPSTTQETSWISFCKLWTTNRDINFKF